MHPREVLRSELIGSTVNVVEAKNSALIGIEGKVIDETKYTLVVLTEERKRKVLMKNQVIIKWKGKIINGKNLVGRPEDRLKK